MPNASVALKATSITPAAVKWLEDESSRRVLHIFERACNLIDDKDNVVSLVTTQISVGPFSILVDVQETEAWPGFQRWLSLAASVRVRDKALHLGGSQVETAAATLWDATPAWHEHRLRLPSLLGELPRLLRLLNAHAPPVSFAHLASPKPRLFPNILPEGVMQGVHGAAQDFAQLLSGALVKGDLQDCRRAASGLAGLGAGLTPSGDDFLVGCVHAVWLTQPRDRALLISKAIADEAARKTTPVSGAWLHAAARGEAGWPWHALLDGIGAVGDNGFEVAARRLVSLGHTSGADALAGFIRCLTAIAPREPEAHTGGRIARVTRETQPDVRSQPPTDLQHR